MLAEDCPVSDGDGDSDSDTADARNGHEHVNAIAHRLRNDFCPLADGAGKLSTVCQETIRITMNEINIRAAQGALHASKRMQLVTYLAFIFIPLPLVSSIFGMNVYVLTNRAPPIRIPIVVGGGVLIPSVFIMIYLGSALVRRWCRRPVAAVKRKIGTS